MNKTERDALIGRLAETLPSKAAGRRFKINASHMDDEHAVREEHAFQARISRRGKVRR